MESVVALPQEIEDGILAMAIHNLSIRKIRKYHWREVCRRWDRII
jgi:hypothetical protein